jgi:hypothetical protein
MTHLNTHGTLIVNRFSSMLQVEGHMGKASQWSGTEDPFSEYG